MEAQERAYNSLSAGTQGGTTTSNINVQNRWAFATSNDGRASRNVSAAQQSSHVT